MVVTRPDGLVIVDVEIEFNFLNYSKVEIDLQHINQGKNVTRKTQFSVEEAVNLVIALIDGQVIELDSQRYYGDDSCNYYSAIKKFQSNFYKLVFCTCTDRPETLGIITLYRLRR
jgi:hypothetical protein